MKPIVVYNPIIYKNYCIINDQQKFKETMNNKDMDMLLAVDLS